jgi:glycosyltransferase involved in cell wall biosynthesis
MQVQSLPAEGSGLQWRPKVTALVPCYNAAEFIEPTLECLAAQTWPDLEIIIADDCSSDATLDIVRRFASKQPNARVVTRGSNLGWMRNSNDLMSQAQGELMFFAFHDDLVAPNYVERLVNALRDRPNAIMAFSDVELTEIDGSRRFFACTSMTNVTGPINRGLAYLGDGENWWVPNRGLFRAEAFRRIGGIKKTDSGDFGDHLWLFHIALLGDFIRVPELLCWKFFKKTSLSKQWVDTDHSVKRKEFVDAIWQSDMPLWQKSLLVGVITGHHRYAPQALRSMLKKALGQFVK